MKRYELTDSHQNTVKVQHSSCAEYPAMWVFADGKKIVNAPGEEFKTEPVSVSLHLNVNQAKMLISALSDLIDDIERK